MQFIFCVASRCPRARQSRPIPKQGESVPPGPSFARTGHPNGSGHSPQSSFHFSSERVWYTNPPNPSFTRDSQTCVLVKEQIPLIAQLWTDLHWINPKANFYFINHQASRTWVIKLPGTFRAGGQMTGDKWQVTCDRQKVTPDKWHMSHDFFKNYLDLFGIGATFCTFWETLCLLYAGYKILKKNSCSCITKLLSPFIAREADKLWWGEDLPLDLHQQKSIKCKRSLNTKRRTTRSQNLQLILCL